MIDADFKSIAANAVLAVILTNKFQRFYNFVTEPAVDVRKHVLMEVGNSLGAGHRSPLKQWLRRPNRVSRSRLGLGICPVQESCDAGEPEIDANRAHQQ